MSQPASSISWCALAMLNSYKFRFAPSGGNAHDTGENGDIAAYPLPTPYEISSLVLEEPEADETTYCEDDCVPMTEPDEIPMPQDMRQDGRRC